MLRELNLPLHYHGYVEGDDIGKGTVDVVVTEGFTGNVALNGGRNGQANIELPQNGVDAHTGCEDRRAAGLWRVPRLQRTGLIRASTMAGCSSASTALW